MALAAEAGEALDLQGVILTAVCVVAGLAIWLLSRTPVLGNLSPTALAMLCVGALMAILSRRLVEGHFPRLGGQKRRMLISLYAGIGVVMISVALFGRI